VADIPPPPPGYIVDPSDPTRAIPAPRAFGNRPVIREAPPKPDKPDKPQFINRVVGDKIVTSRVNPDGSVTDISSGPRWQPQSQPLTPEAMLKIRQDAATKINQIRQLRGRIEGMEFPNLTGAGLGGVLKIIPGTDARGIADSLKQIGSAGALATALQMAKNNGGKNPLQPMSNSDIEMISNITAALDQGQKYSDLRHQLDAAEAAFGHAYLGAGGKSDSLYDKNRADGPFPGQRQQRRAPQRQPRVVDFNDLPE
jgi:hypothetical protein